MRKGNPYIRRKLVIQDGKRDNELSEWHREWQYDKIEYFYGSGRYGIRSYEKSIRVDNEIHRIDSVVESLAIEFQHTLSVSLDEMDLRYRGHLKYGLTPYLVLDFTDYPIEHFTSIINHNWKFPCKTKFDKWKESEYGNNSNLFIDFEDGILRYVPSLEKTFLKYEKQFFLDNLLNLEIDLKREVEIDKKIKEEELKESLVKEAEEKLAREEKLKIRLKKEEQSRLKLEWRKREEWKEKKEYDEEYKYYRFCFEHPLIKTFLSDYEDIIFGYWSDVSDNEGFYDKYHAYYAEPDDCNIRIGYETHSRITEVVDNYGRKGRDFQYLYADIFIRENHEVLVHFRKEKNGNVHIIEPDPIVE
jgi:hypothetical protein